MDMISTIVVAIVIFVGLAIFYRALREPLNLAFGYIGRMFGYFGESINKSRENAQGSVYQTIEYG